MDFQLPGADDPRRLVDRSPGLGEGAEVGDEVGGLDRQGILAHGARRGVALHAVGGLAHLDARVGDVFQGQVDLAAFPQAPGGAGVEPGGDDHHIDRPGLGELRRHDTRTPALLLTARDALADRIDGIVGKLQAVKTDGLPADLKQVMDQNSGQFAANMAGQMWDDQAKLVAEAINATREAGLNANTESPKTSKAGKFAIHSLQMSCRKADLASVLRFYDSVKSRAPYLAIGPLSMTADRGSAGTVTFKATITALELLGELPAGAKAAGEPGVNQHGFSQWKDVAGLAIDELRNCIEISSGEDTGILALKRAANVQSRHIHAARSNSRGLCAADAKASTSTINAIRPSPRMVAPPIPVMGRKLVSRLLITT